MSQRVSQRDVERRREPAAVRFDFRRPDRIPTSQVRAIHLLHDTFVRDLVSSLSAYLRTYLTADLVSVEQLSYAEFLDGLPSPTCMISLGLHPYDGNGVMEVNPSLVFPIIEMLLGGSGKTSAPVQRDITEIEQKVLDGFFRLVLHDLREAWKTVTPVDFTIETMETEPQLLHLMAPNEAVVSIGIEIRLGEVVGMMNIAMPSIVIKMMRQRFDQQWSVRKTTANPAEQTRMMRMLRRAALALDARLQGPTLQIRDLLALRPGSLLTFDYPVDRPLDILVNGARRYTGHVVSTGKKRGCQIEGVLRGPTQGTMSDEEETGTGTSPPA